MKRLGANKGNFILFVERDNGEVEKLKENYYVTLKFDDDTTDLVTMSSNLKQNLESQIKKSDWLECEETQRNFNMNKVRWFQIAKAD
ncbi:hypothetical protein [Paraliobacillus sp. X-1268]|uniref:hypothetical protein n=1 Tax=Paraliobacillus sp. X-1268 TaxID=2213193 RepID=UPI0013007664|nr:hypothetical protein [Paraliobacillus sp. X-1268]